MAAELFREWESPAITMETRKAFHAGNQDVLLPGLARVSTHLDPALSWSTSAPWWSILGGRQASAITPAEQGSDELKGDPFWM